MIETILQKTKFSIFQKVRRPYEKLNFRKLSEAFFVLVARDATVARLIRIVSTST